jgi:hypothetical protein
VVAEVLVGRLVVGQEVQVAAQVTVVLVVTQQYHLLKVVMGVVHLVDLHLMRQQVVVVLQVLVEMQQVVVRQEQVEVVYL